MNAGFGIFGLLILLAVLGGVVACVIAIVVYFSTRDEADGPRDRR